MPNTQNLPTQPLVSFIVTAYNIPTPMLRECLASIVSLSLQRSQREIILVDDGSDISPLPELGGFANDILYIRQPNQGLSAARNMGIRLATGRFMQFVDGDDCLVQPQYEHCLDIIRYHEPVDMVLFHTTKSKSHPVDFSFDGPMTGTQFMTTSNVRAAACGYIFRTDRLGGLRFTAGILHEDEDFTPQLLLRIHNLYTTPARAYYYRRRAGSITHDVGKGDQRLHDTLGVILHLRDIAHEADLEQREALERRVAQLSMDYLVNTIRLTHSRKQLDGSIRQLEAHGLYPLPDRHFTRRYDLFRHLIGHRAGRLALTALL